MKIAEASKVSILQQVPAFLRAPRSSVPLRSVPERALHSTQSQMPLQYIYTLFLEHDLSLGALAVETLAQQKRDYYQVIIPSLQLPLGGSWNPEMLRILSKVPTLRFKPSFLSDGNIHTQNGAFI